MSPFSTLHLLLTSSLHLLLSSSQTVSQSITRKSLCVVFGRTLFSATICLLLLSLSVSFSLSPSPVVPAKATHRRSFFLLLLLKSWKPCEVIWLSADGRAQRAVSARLCVRRCVWVVGEGGIDVGRRERTSSSKYKERASCCESFVNSPHELLFVFESTGVYSVCVCVCVCVCHFVSVVCVPCELYEYVYMSLNAYDSEKLL